MASLNILYAEDEKFQREEFSELLTRLGHKVTVVTTAEELLATYPTQDFNLIITDNSMLPGKKKGVEAVRELRSIGCAIPIVLFTGDIISEEHLQGLDVRLVPKGQGVNLRNMIRSYSG